MKPARLLAFAMTLVLSWMHLCGGARGIAQQTTKALPAPATGFESVTFPSGDGIPIRADWYRARPKGSDPASPRPLILAFHQAGWSRGEYREIAPRLNQLGFDCLAIDQRSGQSVNGVENETAKAARAAGKATSFVDAEQDLLAAIQFAKADDSDRKLVLWGSSYSAALVLKVAGDHPAGIDAVVAFSPGEYFQRLGKPDNWIQESAKKIKAPVFITSARKEVDSWQPLFGAIEAKSKVSFLPRTAGNHGSRALYSQFADAAAYWDAVGQFLKSQVLAPGR